MHNYMPCHMLSDVKMYFVWKAHYVDTVFHVSKSDDNIHAVVVSPESIYVDFTYTCLNGIYILASYIHNAYVTVP